VVRVVGINVAAESAGGGGESGALDGLLHEERSRGLADEGGDARASGAADESGDGHVRVVVRWCENTERRCK